jgi:hypothetical protein
MLYRFGCAGFFLRELTAVISDVQQWPWTAPFPPSVTQVVNERVYSLGRHVGIFSDIEFRVEYSGFLNFFKTGMGESEP